MSHSTTLAPQKSLDIRIRWMIFRDHPRVLQIERESFEHPWRAEQLRRCLRERTVIGMVADDLEAETIAGFMVYENCKTRLYLLNLAVAPEFRGRGVGRACIDKLKSKINPPYGRRTAISCDVRETNLAAQLFFRSMGFRATKLLRDFYDQRFKPEDAYRFEWRQDSKGNEP